MPQILDQNEDTSFPGYYLVCTDYAFVSNSIGSAKGQAMVVGKQAMKAKVANMEISHHTGMGSKASKAVSDCCKFRGRKDPDSEQ